MKKTFAILLTLALLLGIAPFALAGENHEAHYLSVSETTKAPADDGLKIESAAAGRSAVSDEKEQSPRAKIQTPDEAITNVLSLDTPVTVAATGETWFSFTPESTGIYVFDFEGPIGWGEINFCDRHMNDHRIYESNRVIDEIPGGETRYLFLTTRSGEITANVTALENIGAQPLTLNTPVTVTGTDWQYFTYIPSREGDYYFVGKNNDSFSVREHLQNGVCSSEYGDDIVVERYCDAGWIYILAVKGDNAEATGTFVLMPRADFLASVAQPIELDTPTDVADGFRHYYFFTPQISGVYIFSNRTGNTVYIYYEERGTDHFKLGTGIVGHKLAAGTTYYFSMIGTDDTVTLTRTENCGHYHTYYLGEIAPTRSEHGHKAGLFCDFCCEYISGGEVIHNQYGPRTVIKEATAEEEGEVEIVCTVCGGVGLYALEKLEADPEQPGEPQTDPVTDDGDDNNSDNDDNGSGGKGGGIVDSFRRLAKGIVNFFLRLIKWLGGGK